LNSAFPGSRRRYCSDRCIKTKLSQFYAPKGNALMNTKCRCGLMLLFALALSTALVAQQAAGAMRAAITSGPTIQDATDSSMVVVWKTQSPSPSYIYYGPDLARINQRAGSAATARSHQVHLSGLQANSPYYFQVSTPEGKSDIYSAFTV